MDSKCEYSKRVWFFMEGESGCEFDSYSCLRRLRKVNLKKTIKILEARNREKNVFITSVIPNVVPNVIDC